MKKSIKPRKLSLSTTTIRALNPQDLAAVAGGTLLTASCQQICRLKISVGFCD